MNSRNHRLSQNLSMEPSRGIRGTDSRSLRDGTPNPADVVDLISGGALNVKIGVVKQVQGLKKSYLKFYCKFANLLAFQRD